MSNANRDYAIVYDVKNSSLVLNRPLVFYITDKNTSNIFVRLVTRIIVGDGIDQYTDIENATNYILTMRVIKPNDEIKSVQAIQHEPESLFQFNLTEDFKDIPGKYICELIISTIVNGRQELITSDPFNYEVKRSILSKVNIIEGGGTTVEKLLNDLDATKAELSSQIKEKASKNEIFTMANMGQDIKEAMTGGSVAVVGVNAVSDINVVDKKITQDKVNFLNSRGNIFNKNGEKIPNGYYNVGGTWIENKNFYTMLIHVNKNTTYKTNIAKKYNITFWDGAMNILSGFETNNWVDIVTPDNDVYYVALAFHITDSIDNVMIVADSLPSEYIPYEYKLDDSIILGEKQREDLITISKLETRPVSKNRFNKNNIIEGVEIYNDGTHNTRANCMIADYVNIEGLSSICISGLPTYTDGLSSRYLCFYNESKTKIGSVQEFSRDVTSASFTVPGTAKYVSFSIIQRSATATADLNIIQVEGGTTASEVVPYEEGIVKIDNMSIISIQNQNQNSEISPMQDKKVLFFGDSITAVETRYRKQLLELSGMTQVGCFAISGATIKNTSSTVMDGNPSYDVNNTVPNQIQKLLNSVNNYDIPDVIIISASTNDNAPTSDFLENQFTSDNINYIDISNCDLTTYEGAMRWSFEKLKEVYPSVEIVFCTPIQSATTSRYYSVQKQKRDRIIQVCERMSTYYIDAFAKSGIYSKYEVAGGVGKYLSDGLHPSETGGNVLAKCYYRELKNIFIV